MAGWTSRFRRTVGLGGGIRLNVTKRGVGASVGRRGLRRSWHSTGRRTSTVGLPGTGLSWQKIDRISPTKTVGQYPEPGERQAPSRNESNSNDLVDLARRAQREIEVIE